MYSLKHIGTTIILNVLLKLVAIALGIVQLYWLTNVLSTEEYKQLNITASLLSFVALLAGFGIFPVLQKQVTNLVDINKLATIWSTLFSLRLITVVLGAGIAVLIGWLHPDTNAWITLYLFLVSAVILIDYNFFAWFAGKESVWKFTVTDVAGRFVEVGLLIGYSTGWFKPTDNALLFFISAQLTRVLFALVLDYWITCKEIRWVKTDWKIIKELWPSLAPMALSFLFIGLYQHTQQAIMSVFNLPATDINAYTVTSTLVGQGVLAMGVINTQAATMIKHQINTNRRASKKILTRLMGVYGVLLCIAYGVLVLVSTVLIQVLSPNGGYAELSISMVPVFGLFMIFTSLSGVLSYLSILLDQEKKQLYGSIIQCVLTWVLLLLFLPQVGVWAAVWTVVAVSLVELIWIRYPVVKSTLDLIDKGVS
jgi:O-antigen/teichoic acid export membrane protein